MTLREALSLGLRQLKAAGIDGAARDARALLAEAAGVEPSRVSLEGDMTLADPKNYNAMLLRRLNGEPVSKILGRRQFWGREFEVTQDTLDPRPETETLIAAALNLGPVARIADLGTGSGIIAVTMLFEWPGAKAVVTDISQAALDVACRNADRAGVGDRMQGFCVAEPDQWVPDEIGIFDLILSNPPYISDVEMADLSREVSGFDPHIALTPGGDGLSPYRELATRALTQLRSGGHIVVEIGWKQGPDVVSLFRDAGLTAVVVLPDLDGRDRVVKASKP